MKPGNIMVTKAGVKILDFGLAKQASATDETVTARQRSRWTRAYMAPEQLEGKPSDARTDIFALGLMLYEMATAGVVQPVKPGDTARLSGIWKHSPLYDNPEFDATPADWTRNGNWVACNKSAGEQGADVWILPVADELRSQRSEV